MSGRGPKPPAGLVSRQHPAGIAWRVDYDYVGQLSRADAEWLADFTRRYYSAWHGAPGPVGPRWEPGQRAETYRDHNAALAEVPLVVVAQVSRMPVTDPDPPDPEEGDPGQTREYRAAREQVRQNAPSDARRKAPSGPRIEAARRRVKRALRGR